jgi:formylglycine-generating enzyme required for sulfatase activity
MPRLCSSLLLSLGIASGASAVTMAWTPVGNPGNVADTDPTTDLCGFNLNQPCGAVAYTYSIGSYEVTNAQYAEFLNAKAVADPFKLYEINIFGRGGITRSGGPGSYTYTTIAGRENMPVNYIDFFDALRFANWMNNGQGNGDTETGSYSLLGGTEVPSNAASVVRNPGAIFVLPTEHEWYKAAYYDAQTTSYFDYPARSNAQANCANPSATPNTANCTPINPTPYPHDLTAVGSYSGSAGPYGTFDQGGNVYEWNETINGYCGSGCRVTRGGAWPYNTFSLAAASPGSAPASHDSDAQGFRLAMIPEPGTGALVIAGLLGLGVRRRMGA